jgi:hypothetical protein
MKTTKQVIERAFLVYQGGIANVFVVDCFNLAYFGRNARCIYQGNYYGAINYTRGLRDAGATVKTAVCNMAGDIAKQTWSEDFESQPFNKDFVLIDSDKE